MEEKTPPQYSDISETSSVGSDESLAEVTGPDFADFAKQLAYETSINSGQQIYLRPYESTPTQPSGTYAFPSTFLLAQEKPKTSDIATLFSPKTNDITTLFLVDSGNRDRIAYPQPTSLSLRLPRVYKNVKSIQISQVKLLCSFYYFSMAKSNIYLPVIEKGRESITTFYDAPLTKLITIRQGTYGISDLLSELQTELNTTPVFYDFPDGFTEFIKLFTVNGDFSINFNQPGDSYYDRLNSKYIQNPTSALILSYYWGSRYAGLIDYTIDQLKVAYYYPVLYELFLDTKDTLIRPLLVTTVPPSLLTPGETVYSHLVFNMSGINDRVALFLINQNLTINLNGISILDLYRNKNTFRYSLVNRYQVAYDANSLQVNLITTSLNTSLVNLITNTGSSSLTSILTNLGLTPTSYAALQANVGKSAVVYSDMFQFLQSILITYLGIPFAKYAPSYFNNLNNSIYFQNGLNATGILKGYTLEYLTSGQTSLTSTFTTNSNSPGYWPNLNALQNYQGFNPSTINSPDFLLPYSQYGKNFQYNLQAIDSSNYFFNTDITKGTVDVVVKILPAKYTVFKFRSSARQTLQVETLPLPYYYRYADYNAQGFYKGVVDPNNQNVPQRYFDLSYNFLYTNFNKSMDSSSYATIKLFPLFGQSLQTAISTAPTLRANSQNNYLQFEFIAPYPNGISSGLILNATSLSFTSLPETVFTDSFSAFLYHDRGAFMADLQFPRSENPLHYIQTAKISPSMSSLTLNFSTFSGHTYYTIFRSDSLSLSNVTFNSLLYYKDSSYTQMNESFSTFDPNANPFNPSNLSTTSYVINYNTDFTRLPVNVNTLSPDSSTFTIALTIQGIPIGYDLSGVSSDLTDYMGYTSGQPGFLPISKFRIDPLSKYIFQYNSPFDSVNGTYFYSTSQNSILQPITNNKYSFTTIPSAEVKIVHWYDGYSIPIQKDDLFTSFSTLGLAPRSSITEYIQSYPQDKNGNIIFGRGINSIGFLPNDGVFQVKSFAFKSSIYPLGSTLSQEDPNLKIKYLGVFNGTSLVNGIVTLSTALTVLNFSKAVPYGPSTISSTSGYGSELGTWYEYTTSSTSTISGYTPLPTQLLNYISMYYAVPFDANGDILTYTLLTGSLLPYPLAQEVSTGSTFYTSVSLTPPGNTPQSEYIMPVPKANANPALGPQGNVSQIQSQYANSIPITTTSIGFKEISFTVNNSNSFYTFPATFPTPLSELSFVTYFSEYSNTLFTVHSLPPCSNSSISFQCASYTSSISTLIGPVNKNLSSIYYLVNPHPPLQNYTVNGNILTYSTFTFSEMPDQNTDLTIKSFELTPSMSNLTLWMWGGGGGTWVNTSSITGGAGAFVKVKIDLTSLLSCKPPDAPGGISTLYFVVGKGGNRDNAPTLQTVGLLQLYEQSRYGGGGTSLLENFIDSNSICLQGGGFSGIFASPNLLEATPLLIVGGGGAAGSLDLGGPGGFSLIPSIQPVTPVPLSSVTYSDTYFGRDPIVSVVDPFSTPVLNSNRIQNLVDSNLLTFWEPSYPASLNPQNFNPTPNTYGLLLTVQDPLENFYKLRYYGPPQGNTSHFPTGIILYRDQTRSEILYSNTSIKASDIQVLHNGQFLQQYFDIIPPISQLNSNPMTKGAWLIAGTDQTPQSCIQYSLDASTWIPTNNTLLTSVKSILYSSVFRKWFAIGSGPTFLISSVDGINWTPCQIQGFTGTTLTSIAVSTELPICVVGGNTGQLFSSSDGLSWSRVASLPSQSIKIRYLNGFFLALARGTYFLKSIDGQTWTTVLSPGIFGENADIAFGLGKYILVQNYNSIPYNSSLLYSTDLLSWYSVSPLNTTGFLAQCILFANDFFIAGGITTDSSSCIKFSTDGIIWFNTFLPITPLSRIQHIEYSGTLFLALATPNTGSGKSGNQASALSSSDGKTWSYSYSGGFDPDISLTQGGSPLGNSSSYGPITLKPDIRSVYLEIQKTSILPLQLYELRIFNTVAPILATPDSLISSQNTLFYPSELQTQDTTRYTLSFTLTQSTFTTMKIVLPNLVSALFTGVSISIDGTDSTVLYSASSIAPEAFTLDPSNALIYTIVFLPSVTSQRLVLTFSKITQGSLQLSKVLLSYDPTLVTTEHFPSFSDLDNLERANFSPLWQPSFFFPGLTLKLRVSFQSRLRLDTLQLINGPYPPNTSKLITSISIYLDSTKSTLLYSQTNLSFTEYNGQALLSLPQIPPFNYTSFYIELSKNTPGIPEVNQIKFLTLGPYTELPNGFSAANQVTLMSQSPFALSPYNGGGGGLTKGGNSGPSAPRGEYLTGGSPATLDNQPMIYSYTSIQNGAGGGGGGYYGGGGGGVLPNGTGGAGGGGSGFVYSTLFTVLEYGVATLSNSVTPGLDEYQDLLNTNVLYPESVTPGQGGSPSVDLGRGAHGLIALTYEYSSSLEPPETLTIQPSFVDGSKLTVFQAPVTYDTDQRNLAFSSFTDSIQLTQYSGKNWVWYSSYLSLIGLTLTPSFLPSSQSPNLLQARASFPSLPTSVFTLLLSSNCFLTIQDLFTNGYTIVKSDAIMPRIQLAFAEFQSKFIEISYLDTLYKDYTEVYSLLEYLQVPSNLANPHVNPSNPTLDRILGGIPRFGYWANPFLTSASYVGFDVGLSQLPSSSLSTLVQNNNQIQAVYGLVLEMSLITGAYEFKEVMAYKPTSKDSNRWKIATQFPQAYVVRPLTTSRFLAQTVPLQPYTFKNAITARLPLFKYNVYSSPSRINSISYDIPIHVLQDFEGSSIFLYTFQDKNLQNQSSISITQVPLSSTFMHMNQININNQGNINGSILGTLVSEGLTPLVQPITFFGFDAFNYIPRISYSVNDFYSSFSTGSLIQASNVGKTLVDFYGNYFFTDNKGTTTLYQNTGTSVIVPTPFQTTNVPYYSPQNISEQYNYGATINYDFFQSKYTNIWHLSGNGPLSSLYGLRLISPYDFAEQTNFVNQIFYPCHKITLSKQGSLQNPIQVTGDTQTYPSFQHTQMFYYTNYSTLVNDISGQFAMEHSRNFANSDMFSGYGFDSYIYNISLNESTDFNNANADSFNYLAIRGYSPTETFQSLVRFYLPQRYDFGYIKLKDLSNEIQSVSSITNVNPEYKTFLSLFNSAFSTTQTYGSVGFPGFSGSNITTTGFGDFLDKFNRLNTINSSNAAIISSITGQSNAAIGNLIKGDLKYILPSYLANRNRTTDPVEFSLPFSTCVVPSNAKLERYGLGYNIGFAFHDTPFNTVHRATSFFKILDDYIYLQLNEEYDMNKMDISKPENFAQTRDSTAQSGLYNSKLLLNTFGSFATTFIQSPAMFNPPLGKLDKLTFNWFDANGVLLDNGDCEWSATVQITESVNIT